MAVKCIALDLDRTTLNSQGKLSKGNSVMNELIPIRDSIFQEYIFLINNLLVEHCMLLRQVSENFQLKDQLYFEYYLGIIETYSKIGFELRIICNPLYENKSEEYLNKITQMKEKYSLHNLMNKIEDFKLLPKELDELINLFVIEDHQSISIIKGVENKCVY